MLTVSSSFGTKSCVHIKYPYAYAIGTNIGIRNTELSVRCDTLDKGRSGVDVRITLDEASNRVD